MGTRAVLLSVIWRQRAEKSPAQFSAGLHAVLWRAMSMCPGESLSNICIWLNNGNMKGIIRL